MMVSLWRTEDLNLNLNRQKFVPQFVEPGEEVENYLRPHKAPSAFLLRSNPASTFDPGLR
jgi:hypothetical protein